MTPVQRATYYAAKYGVAIGIAICNEILDELDKQFQGFGSADRVAYWNEVKRLLSAYI